MARAPQELLLLIALLLLTTTAASTANVTSVQGRARRSVWAGRSARPRPPFLAAAAAASADALAQEAAAAEAAAEAALEGLVDLQASTFPEYEPLCRERRVRVQLRNLAAGVDYFPPQYDEVLCERAGGGAGSSGAPGKCAHPGFECIQQYSTLFVMRRDLDKDCYTQKATLKVPSGCECMWPTHQLGSAAEHY